jgi:hypothetical protein
MSAAAGGVPGEVRAGRSSERGQVLVLFVLVSLTVFLICVLATGVGQMMVRRHYAQVVADAAAMAGANKQAEGMNLIARYNEKSHNLMTAIQITMQAPFFDSTSTTWLRMVGCLPPYCRDWAGKVLEDYKKIFNGIDGYITAINTTYASPAYPMPAITVPTRAAKRVVEANFAGGQSIFRREDLRSHGVVFDQTNGSYQLVKLSNAKTYKLNSPIHGYEYLPSLTHPGVTCVVVICIDNPVCCAMKADLVAMYGAAGIITRLRWAYDPFEYKFGRYYDQRGSNDVRFTYFVELTSSPVIFGRNFFSDIPTVLAVASAKPYGGYLGTDMEKKWLLGGAWGQRSGREPSYTYKAKLIPVRGGAVAGLAAQRGFDGGARRWLSVTH